MRNWNKKLYLGAMPGTESTIDQWKAAMDEAGVSLSICLTPPAEIRRRSPAYALARSSGNVPHTLDVPIPDRNAPPEAGLFWRTAYVVATALKVGDSVFVHCGAGIGRTGTFAIAVLMQVGYESKDAERAIREIGSFPETEAQLQFVRTKQGFKEAFEEQ
jgi:protein-tyrosine phosphatase